MPAVSIIPWRKCPARARMNRPSGFGGLVIYKNRNTPFWEGFMRMINRYSEQVCIRCGKPGRLRNVRMTAEGPKHTGGWIRPECPRCWDKNGRR